ncbi:MBL fold metallo-hydrolase [Salsipaludibacter albus]|uniref:MBL fold metallo-hydrolase n=1 Tax=Salsipaludibacter albus TaxID=2849650 RepID=UPI001EE3F0B4|nr:MBL fold metallo-hydrolase [Salsipaludibacter albus]MBY5162756.1 MBL fold metallo-hydrolase [Salsipaludibacter albus]
MLDHERIEIDGVFSLDGQDFDVTNNVWLVGDAEEVVVVDAPHDAGPIVEAVGDRIVVAIVCTHGHNDHVNAAVDLADAVDAPIWLHPEDRMLWDAVHPDREPDGDLEHGLVMDVAGGSLVVRHAPGHSPGSCVLVDGMGGGGQVFTGDTLFEGGAGATGRSFSSRPQILQSIRHRLLDLPDDTVVHTGHGPSTTIGAERPGIEQAIADELGAQDTAPGTTDRDG